MKWTSTRNDLPKVIINERGEVNCVLVYKKDGFECGSDIQVWNTKYLNINPSFVTHWMPLPDPPEGSKGGEG